MDERMSLGADAVRKDRVDSSARLESSAYCQMAHPLAKSALQRGGAIRQRRINESCSEFVAHTNGGVDVGRVKVAARHAIVDAAVHGAQVSVEVLVEVVVGIEGKGLEATAAGAIHRRRAAGLLAGYKITALWIFTSLRADQSPSAIEPAMVPTSLVRTALPCHSATMVTFVPSRLRCRRAEMKPGA